MPHARAGEWLDLPADTDVPDDDRVVGKISIDTRPIQKYAPVSDFYAGADANLCADEALFADSRGTGNAAL
jgi:hypothetical protein